MIVLRFNDCEGITWIRSEKGRLRRAPGPIRERLIRLWSVLTDRREHTLLAVGPGASPTQTATVGGRDLSSNSQIESLSVPVGTTPLNTDQVSATRQTPVEEQFFSTATGSSVTIKLYAEDAVVDYCSKVRVQNADMALLEFVLDSDDKLVVVTVLNAEKQLSSKYYKGGRKPTLVREKDQTGAVAIVFQPEIARGSEELENVPLRWKGSDLGRALYGADGALVAIAFPAADAALHPTWSFRN